MPRKNAKAAAEAGSNNINATTIGSPPRAPSMSARTPSPDAASDRPLGPLSTSASPGEREVVIVNTANQTELKNACDDAVKRYLSRPELFKQIHTHTDVRLGLGWLSVLVAGGTALYGYKVEFEQSKPVVAVGLAMYMFLTMLQTLYSYIVEGNIVFVGKRRTFSKRIVTERITLSSQTKPASTSSTSKSSTSSPAYSLSLTYLRSTNGGKSLLARGRTHGEQSYIAFFDDAGHLSADVFEQWVGTMVERAMDGEYI